MSVLSVAGLASLFGSIVVYLAAKLTGRRTSLPLSVIAGLVIGVPISFIIDPIALLGLRGANPAGLIIYFVFFAVLGGLGAAAIPALSGRNAAAVTTVASSPLVELVDISAILRRLSWLRRFEFFTIFAIGSIAYGWFMLAIFFLGFPLVIPFTQLSRMYFELVAILIPIILVSAVAAFFLVRALWRSLNAFDLQALQRRYWLAAGFVLLCCAFAFVVFGAAPKNFRLLTIQETIRSLTLVSLTGVIALLGLLPVWALLSNDRTRAMLALMPGPSQVKAVALPEADAKRARRYTILGLAILLVYPLLRAAIVGAFSAGTIMRRAPAQETTILAALGQIGQTVETIVIVAVVSLLFLRAREHRQFSAAALLTADPRSPILWLRSFRDDEPRRSLLTVRDVDLLDYSRETRLLEHFKGFGPFVGLGVPGEKVPPLGAARAYASEAEWQGVVLKWLASSQLIVVQAGTSPWLTWELEQIIKGGHLPKTMLLMPKLDNLRKQDRQQRTAQRLATVAKVFESTPWRRSLDEAMRIEGIFGLQFAPEGKLTIVRADDDYPAGDIVAAKVLHARLSGQLSPAPAPRA